MHMCWGIYIAIDAEKELPSVDKALVDADGSFGSWRLRNPDLTSLFGPAYSGWLIGHANYCSCDCVESAGDSIRLKYVTRHHLANIADALGKLALLVHWAKSDHEAEQLQLGFGESLTSSQLRKMAPDLDAEVVYWLYGR